MTVTVTPEFSLVPDWGSELPDLRAQDVSDIGIDSADNVYLLYRNPSFVQVSSPDGKALRVIGEGVLESKTHGVTPGPGQRTYLVDCGVHRIRVFDGDGEVELEFGSGPSNPAFEEDVKGSFPDHIDRAYPPFCRPTRVALAESGDLFISDGYGNCRIHHFSADGALIASWGGPGSGPGQFRTPHDIFIDGGGRVLVSDRENDRVQVFDQHGNFIEQWTDLQRPQAVVEGPDGLFYVAESAWRQGYVSPIHGTVEPSASRVSVVGANGTVLGRIGGGQPGTPGNFVSAHGITVDSQGNLYVAEVAWSVARNFPDMGVTDCVTVQKFERAG